MGRWKLRRRTMGRPDVHQESLSASVVIHRKSGCPVGVPVACRRHLHPATLVICVWKLVVVRTREDHPTTLKWPPTLPLVLTILDLVNWTVYLSRNTTHMKVVSIFFHPMKYSVGSFIYAGQANGFHLYFIWLPYYKLSQQKNDTWYRKLGFALRMCICTYLGSRQRRHSNHWLERLNPLSSSLCIIHGGIWGWRSLRAEQTPPLLDPDFIQIFWLEKLAGDSFAFGYLRERLRSSNVFFLLPMWGKSQLLPFLILASCIIEGWVCVGTMEISIKRWYEKLFSWNQMYVARFNKWWGSFLIRVSYLRKIICFFY